MIGRYRPLRVIGKGGQGVVYEAEDPVLDRRIALKLVEAGDLTEVRRVLREARMRARVPHPHIAMIYDVGVVDSEVYLAMELVVGGNLQSWLGRQRRSRAQILDVMRQVAGALAFAHEAGVVHCDVKPHNVLVGKDGRVRVVDFGLARLHRSAAALDFDVTAQIPIATSSYDSESDSEHAQLTTGVGSRTKVRRLRGQERRTELDAHATMQQRERTEDSTGDTRERTHREHGCGTGADAPLR